MSCVINMASYCIEHKASCHYIKYPWNTVLLNLKVLKFFLQSGQHCSFSRYLLKVILLLFCSLSVKGFKTK